MDPELWENPEEFRPERFLVNGRVVKPSYFMPFSVGRRMCIGDSLTRMEVFLFLSCLLQEFELKVPEGHPLPPVEGIAALSMTAQPFQMCAIPRQST
ncbi:Cytochrome P450 18a1, partial [Stegodyphus mimosarum]